LVKSVWLTRPDDAPVAIRVLVMVAIVVDVMMLSSLDLVEMECGGMCNTMGFHKYDTFRQECYKSFAELIVPML